MLLNGLWLLCPDETVRPVMRGEILAADGSWVIAPFLVDPGADRTVFSLDVLEALSLQAMVPSAQLVGLGGAASSVIVQTQLRLTREEGSKVVFRGQYAAVREQKALDMSLLGRDITNLFALIVDRPRDVVSLLGQRHTYTIEQR
jgi:hypothetical protein